MLLDRALLTSLTTPTQAVTALANRGVDPQVRPLLLAHPALPDDHPTLDEHGDGDLRALDIPHTPAARRRDLMRAAGPRRTLDHLAVTAAPRPGDLAYAAQLAARTTSDGTLPRSAAWRLLTHPAAPVELVRDAVAVVTRSATMRDRDRAAVLPAVLRHPAARPQTVPDPVLAAELAAYPPSADPTGAHRAWVADQCRALASAGDRDAAAVLRSAADPDLALALLQERPTREIVTAALASYRLPGHVKHTALRVVADHDLYTGTVVSAASLPLRTAPPAVLREYIAGAGAYWWLPDLRDLAAADASVLDALWDAGQRLARTWVPLHRAAAVTAWALHPCATPALRAGALDVVTDFGCSAAADRARTFSAATALKLIADVQRHGVAGAGLRLAAQARVGGRPSLAPHVLPLAVAALGERLPVGTDPRTYQALVALAPTFHGTLGDLIAAAAAVTA